MSEFSEFTFQDLLLMNYVNADQLTETYSLNFYGEYLTHWPEYQRVARHPHTGVIEGYILGKAEGEGEYWHGHVSAVTVAPAFRRLGLGERLMEFLENVTTTIDNTYFVDLFVRKSNVVAVQMYTRLGYVIYRTVLGYYQGGGTANVIRNEDALDMRKAMPRHATRSKSAVVPLPRPIKPDELEWN